MLVKWYINAHIDTINEIIWLFSTASLYLSTECGQQSHSGESTRIISDTCGSISTVFVWDEDLRGYLYLLRCCEWRSHIMPAVIISTFGKDGPCKNNPRKKGGRVFCQIDGSSFYQHKDLMHRLGTQTHSYRQDNRETGKGWGQRGRSECRLWTTGTGEVSWTFSWTTCLSLCLVSVTTEKLSWPVHSRATSLGADMMHLWRRRADSSEASADCAETLTPLMAQHTRRSTYGTAKTLDTRWHTQSWHLFLRSQYRWGCRSDLMRSVCVCMC